MAQRRRFVAQEPDYGGCVEERAHVALDAPYVGCFVEGVARADVGGVDWGGGWCAAGEDGEEGRPGVVGCVGVGGG